MHELYCLPDYLLAGWVVTVPYEVSSLLMSCHICTVRCAHKAMGFQSLNAPCIHLKILFSCGKGAR